MAENVGHGVGANDCAPNSANSSYSSKHVLEELHFERARKTQLKAEKEEEKRKKQQAILQHAAKSVELLRTEDELKKLMQHLHRYSGNSRNKRKLFKKK